jgi:hypothetical protein
LAGNEERERDYARAPMRRTLWRTARTAKHIPRTSNPTTGTP